jgi:glycosyltransferase involved in cell wall biosynthesis
MTKDIAHYTKKEVKTIPFGIAINSFNPKNLDTSDSKKSYKIGVIKSLEPIYRIDIAIEAIKTLNKSYPNTFDLFICGSGSLETELKKLADNNIYFLGKINQEEVPTFLYTLDIFLNTIEFESFGVSTIEAMACGLPVIAYKAGGAEEIIKHDENGILYTPNTPESLAIAIDEVVKNPQKTRQLGQNARKHIKSNYSLADIQKQIGELF